MRRTLRSLQFEKNERSECADTICQTFDNIASGDPLRKDFAGGTNADQYCLEGVDAKTEHAIAHGTYDTRSLIVERGHI